MIEQTFPSWDSSRAAEHTVSDVLTRELEGVASEHAQELSAVVPGFGAALAWPDAESPQLPC